MPTEHWPEPFLPAPASRHRPLPRPVAIAVVAVLVVIGGIAGTAAVMGGPEPARSPQHIVREVPPQR